MLKEPKKTFKNIVSKVSFKEDSDGEYYSEGFIATTHPDRAAIETLGTVGDRLDDSVIYSIVDEINNGLPDAGAASYRHDWVKQQNPDLPVSGRAVKAEVRKTDDGKIGAWVETHHNKMHPDFEKTKYEVENGYLPGYSIEYENTEFEIETVGGDKFRHITGLSMNGYGFASQRNIANSKAKIGSSGYKEVVNLRTKEEPKMSEEEKKDVEEPKKKEEVVASASAAEEPKKEEEKVSEEETKEKFSIGEEDMKMLKELKESKEKENVDKKFKEMFDTHMKTQMKEMKEKMPLLNAGTDSDKKELKEIKEFVEVEKKVKQLKEYIPKDQGGNDARIAKHQVLIQEQKEVAASLMNKMIELRVPLLQNSTDNFMGIQGGNAEASAGSFKEMEVKELRNIEVKASAGSGDGLYFASNADGWSYGNYNVAPAEFNDIFGPLVTSQINDQTTTWGKLSKKDFSGFSQIQVRVRDGRNSTVGGYNEGTNYVYGSDFTGFIGRLKLTQPYAYYKVLVAVTGQQLRFNLSPGGMGDIWADEISKSAIDLLADDTNGLNKAILGTGDGTDETAALGFEKLILGTSGTLFGRNIATYTTMKSHREDLGSARINLDHLRKMIRYCTGGDTTLNHSNARKGDLVFFTHPLQAQFIRTDLQNLQRFVPTSSRVGFEGMIDFEGVVIMEDNDINADDLFLIDTNKTYIAMNLPPTVEPLPVTADARAAMIKTYFNLFSEAPGNNYWTLGLATS